MNGKGIHTSQDKTYASAVMNDKGRQVVSHERRASCPLTPRDQSPKSIDSKGNHRRHTSAPSQKFPSDEDRQASPTLRRSNEEQTIPGKLPSIQHTLTSASDNHNHIRHPLILCMSPHVSDVQAAASVVGWKVHLVYSNQEAVDAIQTRAYEALIVGFGTLSENPYCSPLVGYAQQASPAMYRIVYSQQSAAFKQDLVHSCFVCGADAVAWSLQSLVAELMGLCHFESIVPAGTKIAAHQRAIYSAYAPLRHRQQREDQLIYIARGKKTTRVRNLMVHTTKLELQLRQVPPRFIQTVSGRSHSKKRNPTSIRLVHISDTNNHHRYLDIPPGDVFCHTGNFTNPDESKANAIDVFQDFLEWLHKIVVPKFSLVVFIAGNHDDVLDRQNHLSLKEHLEAKQVLHDFLKVNPSVRYLEDSATVFSDLVIYGSPTVYCQSGLPVEHKQAHSNAFERSMDDAKTKANLDGVDIFLSNRAPSILSRERNYVLPMDCVYQHDDVSQRKRDGSPHRPVAHIFGHCNHNFGIGYWKGTLMMNGSQELLHSLDKYGGGTPLVVDLPLDEFSKKSQALCGPRLFHRHSEHTIEC